MPRSNTIKALMDFNNLPCDIKQLIFNHNRNEKVQRKYKELYSECVVDEIGMQFRERRFGPTGTTGKQDCFSVLARGRRLRKNGIVRSSFYKKYNENIKVYNTSSEKFIIARRDIYPTDSSSSDEDE